MQQTGPMAFLFYSQVKVVLTFLSLTIVLLLSTISIVGTKLLYLR